VRICVTGGAGFIASHLCDRLLDLGHDVVAVDNLVTGSKRNLGPALGHPRFTFVEADVIDGIPADGPFDRVYHLASPASPIDYIELPFETLYVGSQGTRMALELSLARGARFLLASTSEVYGDPSVHPQREDYWGNVSSVGPRSVYDEAKRYAEALTMAFHRYRQLETRIARIFNTFGPRMRKADGRVVPNFINQALEHQPLTIYGDGTQTRSFCYVSDLVEGLVRLMEGPTSEPTNLGNPHELTMKELAQFVIEKTGSASRIAYRDLPKDDPTRRRPDITRAKKELGWEPVVSFEEGIARTVEYFRSGASG
jgi:dTDP-glucose 4,6-dehydratase